MEVLKYDENGEEEESFRTPDQEQSIGKSSMNAPSLKQQLPVVEAHIAGYSQKTSFFKNFFVYKISVTSSHPKYGNINGKVVERRFTHFLDLFERLSEQHSETTIPCPPNKSMPEFEVFASIESNRTIWLQVFLDLILINPTLSCSQLVIDFLTRDDAPEIISRNVTSVISQNVGKLGEKITSMKYADIDSDQWYIDAKSEINAIDAALKNMTSALGFNTNPNLFAVTCDDFAKLSNAMHQLMLTVASDDTAAQNIELLCKFFAINSSANSQKSTQNIKSNNVYICSATYEQIYSKYVCKLGVVKCIIKTFNTAFERREKLYRPIYDLDEQLIDLKVKSALAEEDSMGYLKKEMDKEASEKSEQVKIFKNRFEDFSKDQKRILTEYKRYLCKYLVAITKSLLLETLEVETNKLASYEQIRKPN